MEARLRVSFHMNTRIYRQSFCGGRLSKKLQRSLDRAKVPCQPGSLLKVSVLGHFPLYALCPMTTGTIFVFIPHILAISMSRSLYLESFSATLTDVSRSDGTAMSINIQIYLSGF